MFSVRSTPRAKRSQANAPSLVSADPPMTPSELPSPCRIFAAALSASDQLTETSSPLRRTIGSVSRVAALRRSVDSSLPSTESSVKRPLSHSHPWFTGSESTPRTRVSRLPDDCTATRQPTAHVVHVLSTCSKSHGRAVKRYGFAVNAPTGQI